MGNHVNCSLSFPLDDSRCGRCPTLPLPRDQLKPKGVFLCMAIAKESALIGIVSANRASSIINLSPQLPSTRLLKHHATRCRRCDESRMQTRSSEQVHDLVSSNPAGVVNCKVMSQQTYSGHAAVRPILQVLRLCR